jgi:ketosteroid isomerase-like protein
MVPTIGRADDADTEKVIGRLSQQAINASVKGDTTALAALVADDFMLINPFGEISTKAGHLRLMIDGALRFHSIEPSDAKVRVYGDAAILTDLRQMKVTYKGRAENLSVRTTEFYVKQAGKWRCVSLQATRVAEPSGDKP